LVAGNTGKELEQEFASWMRERGYRVEVRELVKGLVSSRPWECDLHGSRPSRFARAVLGGALIAIAVCVVILSSHNWSDVTYGGSIVVLVASTWISLLLFAESKLERHVWVECKDRVENVKRDDIVKLKEARKEVMDYFVAVKAGRGRGWRPDELWFVTSADYDQDALRHARDQGVRCFRKTGGSFAEI
jgi:hypothetical protein